MYLGTQAYRGAARTARGWDADAEGDSLFRVTLSSHSKALARDSCEMYRYNFRS